MLSQRGFELGFYKDCHQGTLINDNTVRGSKFETTGAETVATAGSRTVLASVRGLLLLGFLIHY